MEKVIRPYFSVIYSGKDITQDISSALVSISYEDKVQGEADEISIEIENTSNIWLNGWYPGKGDILEVHLGYEDSFFPCGQFEVDELEFAGPPDRLTIRALSAGITKTLRTKRSQTFENQTLADIAADVASRQGLELIGDFDQPILIEKVTQNRETDLGFLRRISCKYGYIFSVKGGKMVFSSIYLLEGSGPIAEIDVTSLTSYNMKDKTSENYSKAQASYHNPDTNEVITSEETSGEEITKEDSYLMYDRAENTGQADAMTKAALHSKNSRTVEGDISLPGNPLILAGINFELTGMGKLSGKYHVVSSSHSINAGQYNTTAQIKKTGEIDSSRWVAKTITFQNGFVNA